MRRKLRKKETKTGEQRKFGIVPKMLLGILIPLFVVLTIMSIFMGLQGTKVVNDTMGDALDGLTQSAASQVSGYFERYYGITECLAATQIIRDPQPRPWTAAWRPARCTTAFWKPCR